MFRIINDCKCQLHSTVCLKPTNPHTTVKHKYYLTNHLKMLTWMICAKSE